MVMVMRLKFSLFPAGRTGTALLAAPGRAKGAAGEVAPIRNLVFAPPHVLNAARVIEVRRLRQVPLRRLRKSFSGWFSAGGPLPPRSVRFCGH